MENPLNEKRNNGKVSRKHWRPAEDEKLRSLVAQFGPRKWDTLAEHMVGRTGKSCRLRWFSKLDPNLNRWPFSYEEEVRLIRVQEVYGNKWAAIARHFPGRTGNAVNNQFHAIKARTRKDPHSYLPPFTSGGSVHNHNIGIHCGSTGTLSESTFSLYAGNNMPFYPGNGTPCPFTLGTFYEPSLSTPAPMVPYDTVASVKDVGNFTSAGEPSNVKDETEDLTNGKVTHPFIDFLGVGLEADHEP